MTNHLREYSTLRDCFTNVGLDDVLHGHFITLYAHRSKSFMI